MGKDKHLEARFTRVYATNLWLDDQSISGPGSRMDSPPVIAAMAALEYAFDRYEVCSVSDVPCGDLNWIAHFLKRHPHVDYKGYDIVRLLIEKNAQAYPDICCKVFDAVYGVLPASDLIFSKDLLIHLDFPDINRLMRNFALSGSKYVLATNNFGLGNSDLMEGTHGDSACRYVDLMDAPFYYPEPLWRTDFFGLWLGADLLNFFRDKDSLL